MKNTLIIFVSAFLLLAGCASPEEQKTEELWGLDFRPNILWITCEDITPSLGCYGDPSARTPNLDQLASEGIRFTNAFSVAGVCAPSRHALITGMYPSSTGGNNMRTTANLVPDLPNYGVVLEPGMKCFSEFLREAGYYCTNARKTDYQFQAPLSAWDECHEGAHWKHRGPGQPFFAIFNFLTTHESRIWTQAGEPLLVDEEEIVIPPYYPEHPTVRRDVARKYSNIAEMDGQVGVILDQLEAAGLLDSTIIFFYSDHGGMLPREKRELYDTGLKVPLLVRFPGKRGAGTVTDELVSFVDFGPTVLSLAGVQVPEYMHGQPFFGSQKSESRTYIYGARDRMDAQYDMVRAVRDKQYKYLRNYHPELPFIQDIRYRKQIPMMNVLYEYDAEGRFEGVQKLWWRKTKPIEELYDTKADPFEFKNLADDPEYAEKLGELSAAMDNWQETYGDKGFMVEADLIREMWGGETQPVTQPVKIKPGDGTVEMMSATEGASISWQYADTEMPRRWNLYTGPFQPEKGREIIAYADRIGYQRSARAVFIMK